MHVVVVWPSSSTGHKTDRPAVLTGNNCQHGDEPVICCEYVGNLAPAVFCYLSCRWDVCVEFVPEDDGEDPPMPESPKDEEQQQPEEGPESEQQ